MTTITFQSEIEDDEGETTTVEIEAEVTTWRDEGPVNDGPLMASLEDMTVSYMDGRRVPSNLITKRDSDHWENRACEMAAGY